MKREVPGFNESNTLYPHLTAMQNDDENNEKSKNKNPVTNSTVFDELITKNISCLVKQNKEIVESIQSSDNPPENCKLLYRLISPI